MSFEIACTIDQLEPRRGAYFYAPISKELVATLSKGNKTRVICELNGLAFRCGLNHLGDGNFFVILSKGNLNKAQLQLGDTITLLLREDPDQLGVAVPEVLEVLLEEDPGLKAKYTDMTDGKKRSFIYSFNKIKNLDKQVEKIYAFFES